MSTTLSSILDATRATLPALRARRAEIEAAAGQTPLPPQLAMALRGPRIALVAEVKRRSPSAGDIHHDLDPVRHAERYARSGAAAISVLTDWPYFGGSLADLEAVARRVTVPVLRKDFILDEVQILEARAAGAAAVLLIVRALERKRLHELRQAAVGLGLEVLVEVHDAAELDVALESGAPIIGVNSRNLDDFRIDTEAAWGLLERIPGDRIAIAESGMTTVADVERAAAAGADAVLIGTALSAQADPAQMVAALSAVPRRGRGA